MAFSVRDPETDQAVRTLARIKGKGLTETIREAVKTEMERTLDAKPLIERIDLVTERYRSFPRTGLLADKAFYDSLNDE